MHRWCVIVWRSWWGCKYGCLASTQVYSKKSVYEREELVWEMHKEEWLRAEPLRVNNQGRNLVGQH